MLVSKVFGSISLTVWNRDLLAMVSSCSPLGLITFIGMATVPLLR